VKTVNQVVTLVLLVLLLVLLPVVATVPDAVLNGIQALTFALEPWALTTVGRVVIGVVAAVLWLLVIWLLWREIRGGGDRSIRVQEIGEGRAQVAESSVARLLEKRVASVPDVKSVRAKVRRTAKEGVVAELTLSTNGEVRLPDVSRKAIEAARSALEAEIGAKVARVDVRVKEVGAAAGSVMAPLAAAVASDQLAEPVWSVPEPEPVAYTEPEPALSVASAVEPESPAGAAPEPSAPSEPELMMEPEPPSWLVQPQSVLEEAVETIEEEPEATTVGSWQSALAQDVADEGAELESPLSDSENTEHDGVEQLASEDYWHPAGGVSTPSCQTECDNESVAQEDGEGGGDQRRADVDSA